MAGSWPGGLQAQDRIPISRFVLQKDSRDSGYYSLCSRPRWGPIKDPSLWCFNPWLFREEKKPLLWTRWCLLHAGSSQAVLRVPPVVLITEHDEGMQWSGRREESRGDPRCSVGMEGWKEDSVCSPVWITNHGQFLSYFLFSLSCHNILKMSRFVKQLGCTLHNYLCMTPAVVFSKHPMMPLFSIFPSVSQIIYIPHTRPYIFPCLSSPLTGV